MRVEVSPTSEEEVIRVIKQAAAAEKTVSVRGGGTGSGHGFTDSADVFVSTLGLQGVIEHHVEDLTAEAWAGTRIADLNKELEKKRQFLPLDPPYPESATIGGTIADGRPGYRRVPGARPRDVLLGFHAVLGDGRLIHFGGRVVKNVTGYEMAKVFAGSKGTLGVMTRVTVRLRAMPDAIKTVRCSVPGLAKPPREFAQALLETLVRAPAPESLAVAWPVKSDADGWRPEDPFIAARFEGLAEDVEQSATRFLGGFGDSVVLRLDVGADDLPWPRVRDFPHGFHSGEPLEAQGARGAVLRIGHRWSAHGLAVALPDAGRVMGILPAERIQEARAVAEDEDGTLADAPVDDRTRELHEQIRKALDPNGTFALGAHS